MARQFGRVVLAGFATVAAIGVFHYALAQMANPPTVPATPATPKSQVMVPTQDMADYVVGMWVVTDLEGANAIAKSAPTTNEPRGERVSAQTLVKDHEQCLAKLQKLNDAALAAIGGAGQPAGGQERVSGYRGVEANPPADKKTSPTTQFCPVRFRQDVNRQLLGMIQQDMNQKQGTDFDKCFIMGEIFGHTHALAELQVRAITSRRTIAPSSTRALRPCRSI